MVELADTIDLGSIASRRGGSSPSIRTTMAKAFLNLCTVCVCALIITGARRTLHVWRYFTYSSQMID